MTVFGPEIIILVVVVGVLIFGAKKIPQLAKTFGKAKGEFEKGKVEADKELKDFKDEIDNTSKDKEVNDSKSGIDNTSKDKEVKSD
jgi:sec-independent protein translocase protein TatA